MIIVFVIVMILLAWALQCYMALHSLDGVKEKHYVSENVICPGESVKIIVELVNTKRRHVPFVKIEQELLNEMTLAQTPDSPKYRFERKKVSFSTWLKPYEKVSVEIPVTFAKRGRYVIPHVVVYGGDFLGLKTISRQATKFNEVVIAPEMACDNKLQDVFGGFLGDVSVRRFLYEDPVLTVGYRDYTGQEPMKMIAWKQSAKGQGLMVRQQDYTVEPLVRVLLNTDTAADDKKELLEKCFSIARTVCQTLEEQGISYDFSTNAVMIGFLKEYSDIEDGLGTFHYYKVLESLGRATFSSRISKEKFFEGIVQAKQVSRGIIVISPTEDIYASETLSYLKDQAGGSLLVLCAQEVAAG